MSGGTAGSVLPGLLILTLVVALRVLGWLHRWADGAPGPARVLSARAGRVRPGQLRPVRRRKRGAR